MVKAKKEAETKEVTPVVAPVVVAKVSEDNIEQLSNDLKIPTEMKPIWKLNRF